jgi:hypothetical protein
MLHRNNYGESNFIFLGGAGRSGTTLLRVMLDAHPRICCGPEWKLLPIFAQWYQTMTGPLAEVMRSYGNSAADLQRHFRRFIEGLVENFLRASGKPRWAEKTPHNVLCMVPLGEIFPKARFLHVVRDGRDVACSLLTMNWADPITQRKVSYVENIVNAACYWRDVVTEARRQAQAPVLAGRVLEVRYEDLVLHTEATLRRILQFLDEPWDEAILSYYTRDRSREPTEASTTQAHQPVTAGSIGRWRTDMTPADRAAFEAHAGDLLRQLGYAADGTWTAKEIGTR